MSLPMLYALAGIGLFVLGLHGLIVHAHLLRKILALNIMGSGVSLLLVALAYRAAGSPDPVPHAMVITGIVVTVSSTALALALLRRFHRSTGRTELSEDRTPS